METKVLVFVELAAGIVLGLMVWSFVSPMISGMAPTTPTA